MSWTKPNGAFRYVLEISSDAEFKNIVLIEKRTDASYTLSDSNLIGLAKLADASYYWRVTVDYGKLKVTSKTYIFHVLADATVYVDNNSTASAQVGNKTFPFKTIQAGIESANTRRNGVVTTAVDVRVAMGTYNEGVVIRPGISVLGGYESANWSRNITGNLTTVTAPVDAAIRNTAVISTADTSTTVIEGFTIMGGATANSYGFLLVQGSPLVKNNIINGGTGTTRATGIYLSLSSPQILNNTITGGSGGNNNGIWLIDSGNPEINGNTILGGTVGTENYAIYNLGSPKVYNNLLMGGTATTNAFGFRSDGGGPLIYHNTINGGNGGNNVVGVFFINANTAIVRNNIIFTSGGTILRCCAQMWTNTTDRPAAFENNNIFDCPTAFYRDGPASNATTMATPIGTGAGTNTLTGFGNVNIDNSANQLFTSINGSDGNLLTMADNDWRLKTTGTICNVRGGGLVIAGYSIDKDGLNHTSALPAACTPSNVGAAGWSMGAFEKD